MGAGSTNSIHLFLFTTQVVCNCHGEDSVLHIATVVKSWDSAYYHIKFDTPDDDDEEPRPDEVPFKCPLPTPLPPSVAQAFQSLGGRVTALCSTDLNSFPLSFRLWRDSAS
jgi:hypothetical protein